MTPSAQLLLDGNRGIYIPKQFAEHYGHYVSPQLKEELDILKAGPDHEEYWEVWDDLLLRFSFTDTAGKVFTLYQDQDLWAIPEDEMHLLDDDGEIPVHHNRYDWIATFYNAGNEIIAQEEFQSRTEHEADNEAMGLMPAGCDDWTLIKKESE